VARFFGFESDGYAGTLETVLPGASHPTITRVRARCLGEGCRYRADDYALYGCIRNLRHAELRDSSR
jgi:hypothetical protein